MIRFTFLVLLTYAQHGTHANCRNTKCTHLNHHCKCKTLLDFDIVFLTLGFWLYNFTVKQRFICVSESRWAHISQKYPIFILDRVIIMFFISNNRHNENAAELFYLESGGNMMDYQAWRKRPPTPQLLSFIRSHSFEKAEESTEQDPNRNVPHTAPRGAEIKIPGIGATPIAISTTLPAAVTQLTQQGKHTYLCRYVYIHV